MGAQQPELQPETRVRTSMQRRSAYASTISGRAVAYSWLLAIAVAVVAGLLNA
jgi:hypothetical protein